MLNYLEQELVKHFGQDVSVLRGGEAELFYTKYVHSWYGHHSPLTIFIIDKRAIVVQDSSVTSTIYQLMPAVWYRYFDSFNFIGGASDIIDTLNKCKKRTKTEINNAIKAVQKRKDTKWIPVKTLYVIPENTILSYKVSVAKMGQDNDIEKPDTIVRVQIRMKIYKNNRMKTYANAVVDLDNNKIVHKDNPVMHNEKHIINEIRAILLSMK